VRSSLPGVAFDPQAPLALGSDAADPSSVRIGADAMLTKCHTACTIALAWSVANALTDDIGGARGSCWNDTADRSARGGFEMKRQRFRRLQQNLYDPLLTALTIMLSILLFVLGPLQSAGVVSGLYLGAFVGLVLIPALFLVSANWLAVAAILVAIVLIVTAAVFRSSSAVDLYLDSAAWLIAGLTLSIVVAPAVFGPGKVTYHRIIGAVFLYIDIGLIFVALFGFVALLVPNAFSNLGTLQGNFAIAGNLIYFSFVTLTTTGFGDIVPLHPYARSLVNVEAIIGQLYPATVLARLVTLELAHEQGG
jgi:hypothetical protein